MGIESDAILPPSHIENEPLSPDQPVRFIWDKTIKKSSHNEKMKARILLQVLDDRDSYNLVPDEDFEKTSLDHTFDQAYKTLRQKFKSQQGSTLWANRNVVRSQRARRTSRKKYVSSTILLYLVDDVLSSFSAPETQASQYCTP